MMKLTLLHWWAVRRQKVSALRAWQVRQLLTDLSPKKGAAREW